MILGKVRGRLVSTIHHPSMAGRKLLVVDLLRADGSPAGDDLIAVDVAGAGAGEIVIVLDEGNGARQILGGDDLPVRSVVVGIVDDVQLAPDEAGAGAAAPPPSAPTPDPAAGSTPGPSSGSPPGRPSRRRPGRRSRSR